MREEKLIRAELDIALDQGSVSSLEMAPARAEKHRIDDSFLENLEYPCIFAFQSWVIAKKIDSKGN